MRANRSIWSLWLAILAFCAALFLAPLRVEETVTHVGLRAANAQGAKPVTSCIRSWGEARYGAVGYNHIVHVADGCDAPAECVVSTDVNPEPQTVTVPPHAQVDVVTFLGSPARVFVPRVVCTMQAP
jgi:hypothetical protein